MSQLQLLRRRGFNAYYWTQFSGAFNDNLFKTALALIITFRIAWLQTASIQNLVILAAGLFILPFFLFSALAGQLADKYEKAQAMRVIKLAEIVIMCGAVAGFILNSVPLLLLILFLMGTQSAFFGPVKYGIIPQLTKLRELTAANGLVGMGTFVAILGGTILGGAFVSIDRRLRLVPRTIDNLLGETSQTSGDWGIIVTCTVILILAIAGWLFSRRVPRAAANQPDLQIKWNIITQTGRLFRFARGDRPVFWNILAISWFWFYGAVFIQLLPTYTKLILQGNEAVATICLTMFSVGIGAGSLSCELLSAKRTDTAIVFAGALGLTFFPVITWTAGSNLLLVYPSLLLIGFSGGLFFVPLYAWVQRRAEPRLLARTIAAGNLIDALYMVLASVITNLLIRFSLREHEIFLLMGIINIFYMALIISRRPELAARFSVWMRHPASRNLYRINDELLPVRGPALIILQLDETTKALLKRAAYTLPRWPKILLTDTSHYNPLSRFFLRIHQWNGSTEQILLKLQDSDPVMISADKFNKKLQKQLPPDLPLLELTVKRYRKRITVETVQFQ